MSFYHHFLERIGWNEREASIDDLPEEILEMILEYVPRHHDNTLIKVSTKWSKIIKLIRNRYNCNSSNRIFTKYPLPLDGIFCCLKRAKKYFRVSLHDNHQYYIHNFYNGGAGIEFMNSYLNYETYQNIVDCPYRNQLSDETLSDLKIGYQYAKEIIDARNQVCLWCFIKSLPKKFDSALIQLFIMGMIICPLYYLGAEVLAKTLIYNKIIVTKKDSLWLYKYGILVYCLGVFGGLYWSDNQISLIRKMKKTRINYLPHLLGYRKFKFVW